MMNKDKTARDSFTLSLGGMNAVTGYYAMPAIRHERLRQDQRTNASEPRQWNWRLWMPRRFRVV